jgi:hypothetical protein
MITAVAAVSYNQKTIPESPAYSWAFFIYLLLLDVHGTMIATGLDIFLI